MRRIAIFTLIAVTVFLTGLNTAHSGEPARLMKLVLPKDIRPEKVKIVVETYGKGLSVGNLSTTLGGKRIGICWPTTKPGVYDYDIYIQGMTARLFLYTPGYKMIN